MFVFSKSIMKTWSRVVVFSKNMFSILFSFLRVEYILFFIQKYCFIDWDKICWNAANALKGRYPARSIKAMLRHNDCYLLKKSLMEKNTREREDNKLTVRSGRRRMAACEGGVHGSTGPQEVLR